MAATRRLTKETRQAIARSRERSERLGYLMVRAETPREHRELRIALANEEERRRNLESEGEAVSPSRRVSEDEEPATQRRPARTSERGFITVEHLAVTSSAIVGFVGTPLLNQRIEARPFGQYMPPSVGASVISFVAGLLARRAGYKKTGKAAVALGAGMAVGTIASRNTKGGLMSPGGW